MNDTSLDVVIVGGGPNGLTAAAVLGHAGLRVALLERSDELGGSCRTAELTMPGFRHDICAAIHPMGAVSPVFSRLHLQRHGLQWIKAPLPLAHPLGDGRVMVLSRRMADTAATLGVDGETWASLMSPFVARADAFISEILRPVRIPRHPFLMARFGWHGLRSCTSLAGHFRDAPARALFAGIAAHSLLPLDSAGSASFGLALAVAGHALDWPCAAGGSQRIVEALAAEARSVGCELRTGAHVETLRDLPPARAVLFDVTPRQLIRIAGTDLPATFRRRLGRYKYAPGSFKIDYALARPIPWRDSVCGEAATVHLGATLEEIARSEADANAGLVSQAPFVLVAQQSHFDSSRAPAGASTGWAYCHVPNGCTADMTDAIERQIERFAPGFRDTILMRHVLPPAGLEAHNPNLVGGDIGGGANTLGQFLFRPVGRWDPYTTGNPRLFLCSSSTPPGGGVHGMCGYWAARSVLRRVFGKDVPAALRV
jgi:phytoene dehydrogenase-like protein